MGGRKTTLSYSLVHSEGGGGWEDALLPPTLVLSGGGKVGWRKTSLPLTLLVIIYSYIQSLAEK